MGAWFTTPEEKLRAQERVLARLQRRIEGLVEREEEEARDDWTRALNAEGQGDRAAARDHCTSAFDRRQRLARYRRLVRMVAKNRSTVLEASVGVTITRAMAVVAGVVRGVNTRVNVPDFALLMRDFSRDMEELGFKMETVEEASDMASASALDQLDAEVEAELPSVADLYEQVQDRVLADLKVPKGGKRQQAAGASVKEI